LHSACLIARVAGLVKCAEGVRCEIQVRTAHTISLSPDVHRHIGPALRETASKPDGGRHWPHVAEIDLQASSSSCLSSLWHSYCRKLGVQVTAGNLKLLR